MFIAITILCFVASLCTARPSGEHGSRNVITVPPNCPPGQELVNGVCRDVWRAVTPAPANIISVPPNCPPGQQLVNGRCQDVWRRAQQEEKPGSKNVIETPDNCPPGQALVNGVCRDVWRRFYDSKNVIVVPDNCPPGQYLVNGACREIMLRFADVMDPYFNGNNVLLRKRQVDNGDFQKYSDDISGIKQNVANKNIVSVPNQCPVGFRPDALGICRPIF